MNAVEDWLRAHLTLAFYGFVLVGFTVVTVAGVRAVRQFHRNLRRIRLAQGICHMCGYNLTGNVSGVCPECGEPVGTKA